MALVLESTEERRCHLNSYGCWETELKLPIQIQSKRLGENTFGSAKDKIVKG